MSSASVNRSRIRRRVPESAGTVSDIHVGVTVSRPSKKVVSGRVVGRFDHRVGGRFDGRLLNASIAERLLFALREVHTRESVAGRGKQCGIAYTIIAFSTSINSPNMTPVATIVRGSIRIVFWSSASKSGPVPHWTSVRRRRYHSYFRVVSHQHSAFRVARDCVPPVHMDNPYQIPRANTNRVL